MQKKGILNLAYLFAVILLFFALLSFSSITTESAYQAISLCAKRVIPSLFPFFVISNLFINLKLHRPLARVFKTLMPKLFSLNPNSSAALILGLISGYPLGAATCAELYRTGEITRREAERLLAFCNNSGPGFILGICGLGVFGSLKIGIALFLIHISTALIAGVSLRVFSPIKVSPSKVLKESATPSFSLAFTDAIARALSSSLRISAYIIFFAQICALLENADVITRLLNFLPGKVSLAESIICGILEITSGIYKVAEIATPETAFILIATFLGFGGFSVHFQALSFVTEERLNTREYFFGKVFHGILSGVFAAIFSNTSLFKSISVFSQLYEKNPTETQVFLLPIIFILFLYIFSKKAGKKHKNSVY